MKDYIEVYAYNIKNLGISEKAIWFYLVDYPDPRLRIPPRNSGKVFLPLSQVVINSLGGKLCITKKMLEKLFKDTGHKIPDPDLVMNNYDYYGWKNYLKSFNEECKNNRRFYIKGEQ